MHDEASRNIFQPFADFIADEAQGVPTVWTAIGHRGQADLFPGQFRRQGLAPGYLRSGCFWPG